MRSKLAELRMVASAVSALLAIAASHSQKNELEDRCFTFSDGEGNRKLHIKELALIIVASQPLLCPCDYFPISESF